MSTVLSRNKVPADAEVDDKVQQLLRKGADV